jgi:hypothetical protein
MLLSDGFYQEITSDKRTEGLLPKPKPESLSVNTSKYYLLLYVYITQLSFISRTFFGMACFPQVCYVTRQYCHPNSILQRSP